MTLASRMPDSVISRSIQSGTLKTSVSVCCWKVIESNKKHVNIKLWKAGGFGGSVSPITRINREIVSSSDWTFICELFIIWWNSQCLCAVWCRPMRVMKHVVLSSGCDVVLSFIFECRVYRFLEWTTGLLVRGSRTPLFIDLHLAAGGAMDREETQFPTGICFPCEHSDLLHVVPGWA